MITNSYTKKMRIYSPFSITVQILFSCWSILFFYCCCCCCGTRCVWNFSWLLLHIFPLLHNEIATAMSQNLQRCVKINSNILSVWMDALKHREKIAREWEGSCGLLEICVSKWTIKKKIEAKECNIWRNVHRTITIA